MYVKRSISAAVAVVATVAAIGGCSGKSDNSRYGCDEAGSEIFLPYSPKDAATMARAGATTAVLGQAYDASAVKTAAGFPGTRFKIKQSKTVMGTQTPAADAVFEIHGSEKCAMSGYPVVTDGFSGAFIFKREGSETNLMGAVEVPARDIVTYTTNPAVVPPSIRPILTALHPITPK